MCRRSPTASGPGRRPGGSSTRRGPRRRSCVQLASPWLLALLVLVPLALPWRGWGTRTAAVRYPTLAELRAIAPRGAAHRRAILSILRAVAPLLILLALPRPPGGASRVDVVRSVVKDFVAARPEDRIGLLLFAARPYTQCPLTLDHGWLMQNLERAQVGMIEDGTAIG